MHSDGVHYSQTKQVFCRFNRVHLFLGLQQRPPDILEPRDDVHIFNHVRQKYKKEFCGCICTSPVCGWVRREGMETRADRG